MSRVALLVLAGAFCALGGSAHAQTPLEATCPSVSYRGPIIVATCYNAYMGLVRSSIDTRGCTGAVGNVNGQLACPRGYGYGGGYGYGPRRYGY